MQGRREWLIMIVSDRDWTGSSSFTDGELGK